VVAVRFEIEFHTPFRVASGRAGGGSDATVDAAALLPASSLKGVMRSAARDLLRFPRDLVEAVFGTARQPSPWAWSDARVLDNADNVAVVRPRARIQIEPATGTVRSGALLIAEEVLATRGEFTIDRIAWLETALAGRHETVLLAAARAVTAVGGDRRRGLGWVSITPADPPWSADHLRDAAALAGLAARDAVAQRDSEAGHG
jgi:CRISPR/Cas system CSM-associated protein Csm3 (group 7 of RAMP superfamily)